MAALTGGDLLRVVRSWTNSGSALALACPSDRLGGEALRPMCPAMTKPLDVHGFPRPPAIEEVTRRLRIVLGGEDVADTRHGWRILETTHPPTYYLPMAAFGAGVLVPRERRSFCEWKGSARYLSVRGGGRTEQDAAWFYPEPALPYAALRDHVAVYAGRMDACFVDDEQVVPQPGGFYGGWITSDLVGPFKGAPGTEGW